MFKEATNTGHCQNALSTEGCSLRRRCGCIRTNQKLKQILQKLPAAPAPPPSTPVNGGRTFANYNDNACYYAQPKADFRRYSVAEKQRYSVVWPVISEFVFLVQLLVTATALTIYYLIYCYMELIYYTLRSVVYFHNADIPMKLTLTIVTATSVLVAFNLLMRIEKVLGMIT